MLIAFAATSSVIGRQITGPKKKNGPNKIQKQIATLTREASKQPNERENVNKNPIKKNMLINFVYFNNVRGSCCWSVSVHSKNMHQTENGKQHKNYCSEFAFFLSFFIEWQRK